MNISEQTDRKNRIFFTLYCQYLPIHDRQLFTEKINGLTGVTFPDQTYTVRQFSYVLSDCDIANGNEQIDMKSRYFRGKCLEKINEIAVHYSDRNCQIPRITMYVNAMNKFSDLCDGAYFT